MDELYIKTKNGSLPIDPSVARKYHLEAGEDAPFTHDKIVDASGRAPKPRPDTLTDVEGEEHGELLNDEIAILENGVTLSQSEIIDFGQGTDSSNR